MTSAWNLLEFPGKQIGGSWVTVKTTIHTCSGFKQSEPPLDCYMPVNLSLVPVKNTVASTKYQLKLSVLYDLLETILCTLGPEASGSSH